MAEIANTMSTSSPIKASSGQIISAESPESVLLSSGVREAMDLMFPKSATQLLQRGLSFEDDKFMSGTASKENMHPSTTAAPASYISTITLPCSVSSAYITATTTATVTAVSTEVVTSVFGNGSPVVSSSPFVSTYSPPVFITASKSKDEDKDSEVESRSAPLELPRKTLTNIKITKADIEIIGSCDQFDEKSSTRVNSVDLSSECQSRDNSDSEDMRRPFVTIARDKKKKKKRKTGTNSLVCEIGVKTGNHVKESESVTNSGTDSAHPDDRSVVSPHHFISDSEQPRQNCTPESLYYDNMMKKSTLHINSLDCSTQNMVLENGSLTNDSYQNSAMTTKDTLNISLSSINEKVQNESEKSKQKLPKLKRLHFNIVKHKNKIRNAFPPCFVVVKQIHAASFCNLMKDFCMIGDILPLSVRLKHLSDLCDKGFVTCKNKKVAEELVYKNIFEETVLPVVSEHESENARGRSLRKRDKHISYVEPSEDDILDEFFRKRPRTKHKDSAGRSEDESSGESKKRKKQNLLDSKAANSDVVTSVTIATLQYSNDKPEGTEIDTTKVMEIKKKKITKKDKLKVIDTDSTKIGPKEIIVYPPTSLSVQNSYCFRVAGSSASVKSKHISYSQEKDKNSVPVQPTSNISILPPNTLPRAFLRHPNPVMLFPSLPLGFPGVLPAKSVGGVPISTPVSTAGETQKPPQYCVVKMDGKDVLLQLVPSSGIGVPVPVVVPKGKALFVPPVSLAAGPSHLLGQPLRQMLSVAGSTQAVPAPSFMSIATSSQGSAVSTAPIQSFGIPVISKSAQNVSLSTLPVIQAAQLTSFTSTASIIPLNLTTSERNISQNVAAGLSAPVNEMPSANFKVSSVVTPTTSSTFSSPTLPGVVTPMAAPNTTTVVRSVRLPGPNLRTVLPNQSTSLHSVRIFVPGCSAIGTPGRFATIGSIANSSPLTHMTASSALLPQRKPSSDQELTPEQVASRRRKLEKKYPLPPGVVIKTEPLDTVPKPSSTITAVSGSRSLLSQNLHLLSTSRPGPGIQSIRIISPSLATALSLRSIRGNSNIIYRATSIGGGQTVLLPASFEQISTKATTLVTSTSITPSSFASSASSLEPTTVTSTATTTVVTPTYTTCNSSTSATTTVLLSTASENSSPSLTPAPWLQVSENGSGMPMSTSGNTTELLATGMSSTQGSVISRELPAAINCSTTSLSIPLNTSCESSGATAVTANSRSDNDSELSLAKAPSESVTLGCVRTILEELRKIIQVQELRGLKGERLEKLKELLRQKEEHYMEIQKLNSGSTSLPAVNGDISEAAVCESGEGTVSVDSNGGSETDPFVID